MLTNLEFRALIIQKETIDDVFYDKVSNIQIVEKLESVCLFHFDVDLGDDSMKNFNLLLFFILQSCPNLKKIKLVANKIFARGGINVDFRQNSLLRHIEIHMPNCRYYTFHNQFGKYWRSINNQITRDGLTQEEETKFCYHVNLAWDITKDINLQLTGCGL